MERVNPVHTKELQKYGPFQVLQIHTDSEEHKTKMNGMHQEVQHVLKAATFGGAYMMVLKWISGKENHIYDNTVNLMDTFKVEWR